MDQYGNQVVLGQIIYSVILFRFNDKALFCFISETYFWYIELLLITVLKSP